MYFHETDYDDMIRLDYRKKSAVRTALENLIQEESHADGKDEHFVTLATLKIATLNESRCRPTYGAGPALGIYILECPWHSPPNGANGMVISHNEIQKWLLNAPKSWLSNNKHI